MPTDRYWLQFLPDGLSGSPVPLAPSGDSPRQAMRQALRTLAADLLLAERHLAEGWTASAALVGLPLTQELSTLAVVVDMQDADAAQLSPQARGRRTVRALAKDRVRQGRKESA